MMMVIMTMIMMIMIIMMMTLAMMFVMTISKNDDYFDELCCCFIKMMTMMITINVRTMILWRWQWCVLFSGIESIEHITMNPSVEQWVAIYLSIYIFLKQLYVWNRYYLIILKVRGVLWGLHRPFWLGRYRLRPCWQYHGVLWCQ